MPAGPHESHHKCLSCSSAVSEEQSRARTRTDTCCCCSWDSQTWQKSYLGQQTEKNGYVSHKAAETSAQPRPSALQSLLLPHCTQQPQGWDTLKMPRGNGSITATAPQGHAAETLPPFLGMLSTAFTASNTPPEPAQGDLSLPCQAKPSCSSDAARSSIPTPPRAQSHRSRPITWGMRLPE